MVKKVSVIEQEYLYRGFLSLKRIRLQHTLFEGGWSDEIDRELIDRGDCVAVLLYDPDVDAVVLIEQFRVGALGHSKTPWLLEIVAGVVESGESLEAVAYRETVEEAGCMIEELRYVCEYYSSPGALSERMTLFCGRVDSSTVGGVHGVLAEHEDINVRVVPFEEAFELMTQGKLNSATPIIGLQWLALNREQLQCEWGRMTKES
ncbi:MAG TPA: NUDIX domain-containing protein [Methylococcaceae bacterium]|nr:NUDIX domain-containing protein [Methylococcaceae bacterium]HIL40020.1 NUDIX domain-containing protein [Methylococcales bacterium]